MECEQRKAPPWTVSRTRCLPGVERKALEIRDGGTHRLGSYHIWSPVAWLQWILGILMEALAATDLPRVAYWNMLLSHSVSREL